MRIGKRWGSWMVVGAIVYVFLLANIGYAVVLHPAGEPPADWADKPVDEVMGRFKRDYAGEFKTKASSVAIGPNHAITTIHQGGGVGCRIAFGEHDYIITNVFEEPGGNDIRVVRLRKAGGGPANLVEYVAPYTKTDEAGKRVVIGGYGKHRASAGNPPNGYNWEGGQYEPLRWGENRINSASSCMLTSDFDAYDGNGSLVYECALAEYDSGGGWFIEDLFHRWFVAGLSRGVGHFDVSYFDPPEYNDAVRVSVFATWINDVVENEPEPSCSQPPQGDINGDCLVNNKDIELLFQHWLEDDCGPANDYCGQADIAEPFGKVDLSDYAALLDDWLECGWTPDSYCP